MKYDAQLTDLKTQINPGKKILIVTPSQITVDKLASSLGLMLSLKAQGYTPTIVTEGTPLVSHSNLFGIGELKNNISQSGSGNFVVTLEGVVETNGQIPTLEKLDWYPEGNNLNLVFHNMPGQKFEPKNIVSKYSDSGFEIIFVLGAASLSELGNIYSQNTPLFNSALVVNIDNNSQNTNFGKVNVVDPNASSVSEMMVSIFPSLSLNMDLDIASNIVAGVYDATSNMTQNVKPDTFMAVGQAMQAGGKLPQPNTQPAQTLNWTVPQPPTQPEAQQPALVQVQPEQPITPPQPQFETPVVSQPVPQFPAQDTQTEGFDLSKVLGMPQANETFVEPPVSQNPVGTNQASTEEKPSGEQAVSSSIESETQPTPDWLTPKIFKGGSLG